MILREGGTTIMMGTNATIYERSVRGKPKPKGGDDVSLGWVGLVDWLGWVD